MGEIKTHRALEVWKNSVQLVTDVYKITESFPKHELFGLSNQVRRAAVSIPSNIAEGAGRFHDNEFAQFLHIASGSLAELETQLIIAKNLQYINDSSLSGMEERIRLIRSQIFELIRKVKGEGVRR